MNTDALKFLKNLMQQPSPSGFEAPAQKVVRERMRMFADRVTTDVHGNVVGVLNESAPFKVMLAGHVDEIGLLITHIDEKGFVYFAAIGGWDAQMLLGQRVWIMSAKGRIPGIVGRKPIHLLDESERAKPVKLENLWIDIGAKNKADALKSVAVGDPVVIKQDFIELKNDLVAARAFDDRIGAWAVVETLGALRRHKLNVAVYAVSTVQEEVGLRGATTSAYNINPAVGIAVDVGFTSDSPGSDPKRVGDVAMNRGPILHQGANINPVLGKLLCNTARRKKIKFQMQAEPRGTGTDANVMQLARGGCAAALVSVPNRYMHSPVEVISLRDLNDTVKLLAETILTLTGRESFIPA